VGGGQAGTVQLKPSVAALLLLFRRLPLPKHCLSTFGDPLNGVETDSEDKGSRRPCGCSVWWQPTREGAMRVQYEALLIFQYGAPAPHHASSVQSLNNDYCRYRFKLQSIWSGTCRGLHSPADLPDWALGTCNRTCTMSHTGFALTRLAITPDLPYTPKDLRTCTPWLVE
jgi:hypothetical protein